ncbi:MAG: hypothetical protein A3J83_01020 [Elusimicrobia bacterium RIFOXYA2_FULL_40_6]|nr:MAG: hypothetical protein A3J83_01020 [Elusimicrobia bacterium RIFOXYA2_FULL_40_6]
MQIIKKVVAAVLLVSSIFASAGVYAQQTADPQKVFNYAEALFDAKQYQKAVEAYMQVIYLCPKNDLGDKAQYKIAESLFANSDRYQAIDEWKRLIEKYPGSELAIKAKEHIKLAEIVIQDENPPEKSVEDQVCRKYITFGWDYLNRSCKSGSYGVVYNVCELNKGTYWLDKVIKEYPKSPLAAEAQYNRGEALILQSNPADFEKATVEYQKTVDIYPTSIYAKKAAIKIGDVFRDNIRNKKKAVEAYQKVVDMYKGDPNNYFSAYAQTQIDFLK